VKRAWRRGFGILTSASLPPICFSVPPRFVFAAGVVSVVPRGCFRESLAAARRARSERANGGQFAALPLVQYHRRILMQFQPLR